MHTKAELEQLEKFAHALMGVPIWLEKISPELSKQVEELQHRVEHLHDEGW